MDYLQVYLNNMQIFWATSGVLGRGFEIVLGVLIGAVCAKLTLNAISRIINIELRTSENADLVDIVGDVACDRLGIEIKVHHYGSLGTVVTTISHSIDIAPFIGVLGFLLCLFTLDIVGLVVYVASLVLCPFILSRIEFRQWVFKLVEGMVKNKYNHQDVNTDRIARQMYKTLKSEIKPGRSYIDFCEITALILERYSQGAETLDS